MEFNNIKHLLLTDIIEESFSDCDKTSFFFFEMEWKC